MRNHTELLNYLAVKYGLNYYLEIGVQNKANNYNKIICPVKVGVDPNVNDSEIRGMSSDDYFEAIKNNKPPTSFDLIFIDGYHEAEQVKRDFENSLKCLRPGGFIVIHDTLPENEAGTRVPRETKVWWGDVYKFAMKLGQYDGIDFVTFDMDNGCTVAWNKPDNTRQAYAGGYTFDDYMKYRHDLLRIKPAADIEKYL